MQLISFSAGSGTRAGLRLDGDLIFDVQADMAELLRGWPRSFATLPASAASVRDRSRMLPAHTVSVLAPIPAPSKVVAIGLNYIDHCRETGQQPPKQPVIFAKFPTSVIGPGEPVSWPMGLTEQVDWEVELAVVIGRTARHVPRELARDVIAGYTVGNDVSARDLQFGDGQFVRGKSLDSFCPLGPALVTPDEVGDPTDLDLRLEVNGQRMQDSNTSNLIFDIDDLIAVCSRAFTLLPGDVILTGTPAGVGFTRKPPVFLNAGDRMVAWIERLGALENPVGGPQPVPSGGGQARSRIAL